MQQINPLISLLTAFLVLFLAAIPPVALFLSFELLLAQLKQTAVRLEAQNSLDEIVREIRE